MVTSHYVPPAGRAEPPIAGRRDEILVAAREVIEEFGPDAQTGQIAERAGLARPNMYRHFASKDDLDQALARRAYKELRRAISGHLHTSGFPIDVVRAPIEAQVNWAEQHPNLYRFLVNRGYQRATSAACPTERSSFAAELAAAGGRYFPGFVDDPDTAEATMVGIIGLVDASVLRWLDGPNEDREHLINRLTGQCWILIDHYLHEHGIHVNPTKPLPPPVADSTENTADTTVAS